MLDELDAGPANVLGWSDGAIEALLLGIRHANKVKKIAAMAANLSPGPLSVVLVLLVAALVPAKTT